MKIIAIGTSEFLASSIRGLVHSDKHQIVEVITLTSQFLPENAYNLESFCDQLSLPYREVTSINSFETKDHLSRLAPDLIFSAWPKLLDEEVLAIPTVGIIGTHPTPLPFNRGRHPLHWQIVLGLTSSKLSFFWMNEGVDSGSIILQVPYTLERDDTILTVNQRVNEIAYSGCKMLSELLNQTPIFKGSVQDESYSNVWRKRGRHDVLIDFRMNCDTILALVRSFTEPYPCASFIFESSYIQVIAGQKVQLSVGVPLEYFEPGYVFNLKDDTLCIKVADGVLLLRLKQKMESLVETLPKYIHPPTKYLVEYPELARFLS
jgi:methionyl-tRNA formyltransferase